VSPLVWWLWFGGILLVVGGIVTLWPSAGPNRASVRRALEGYQTRIVDQEEALVGP